jgi:hypothetical protein
MDMSLFDPTSRILRFKELCLDAKLTRGGLVMILIVSLVGLENTSDSRKAHLWVCLRAFPERIKEEGKTSPKWARDLDCIKREKESSEVRHSHSFSSSLSLLPDCYDTSSLPQHTHIPPTLSHPCATTTD